MKHESKRVVVITGASSGIGKATALRFAKNGDNVVLAARRKNLLKKLVEEVEQEGGQAIAVETDVADSSSVEKLANAAVKKFGHIDVWINNAGIGATGKFHEIPLEDHEQVLDTNVRGTLYGSYEAIKQFREQEYGTLINISSVLGKVTQPLMSSYTASKYAIRALTASIRQELWLDDLDDIHACTVFPESIDTPFFDHEANYSGYKVRPLPPIDTPEHVAEVIFDLAENPQDEVHVGKTGRFLAMQQKVARGATEKQMSMYADRTHLDRNAKQEPTSGSIHEPRFSDRGSIRAGWKSGRYEGNENKEEKSNGSVHPLRIAGLVAPAAIGIFFLIKGRKHNAQQRAVA